MNGVNENPLIPNSMVASRNQRARAQAVCPCDREHTPCYWCLHEMVGLAVEVARRTLVYLASWTDDPVPGVVEAADSLGAAAHYLAGADFCQSLKGGRGGA